MYQKRIAESWNFHSLHSHVIWQKTLGERQERAGLCTELSPELRNLSKLEKKKTSESIKTNIKAESEQRNDAEEYMVVIQFGENRIGDKLILFTDR